MFRNQASKEQIRASKGQLERADAHHLLRVLRVKVGSEVEFFDGGGLTRRVEVVAVERNSLTWRPLAEVQVHKREVGELHLFQCVAKGKRMDWLVEKAVELGVSKLIPVCSAHTVAKATRKDRESTGQVERWQRIADGAMRQCGAVWRMDVEPIRSFESAVERLQELPVALAAVLSPQAVLLQDKISQLQLGQAPQQIGWLVGPEGDFSVAEQETLGESSIEAVSLGPLVLRTETAALFGLSVLGCYLHQAADLA